MKPEKRKHPWYFKRSYGRHDKDPLIGFTGYVGRPEFNLTLTGTDPEKPMVQFPGEETSQVTPQVTQQVGLQKGILFDKVMCTRELTINLPSAHLNSSLVTSLLIDFLPHSEYLEHLTIRLTDSRAEELRLEKYGEILAAFRDQSITIQSIEFQDVNGFPFDFQHEEVLLDTSAPLDESDTFDRSVDTSSDLGLDVTSGPKYVRLEEDPSEEPLADIFSRNKKDSRKRLAVDVLHAISNYLGIAACLFFPIYMITAIGLRASQSPISAAFGAYGAAAMGGCLLLAGIAGAIFWIANRRTLAFKSRNVGTALEPNEGIRIDVQEHALRKAISNACRDEKKETGYKERYEFKYYHPQKGLTQEMLTWQEVQDRVESRGIKVPGPTDNSDPEYEDYTAYYHLPRDLVVEGTDKKDPRDEWFQARRNFLSSARRILRRRVHTHEEVDKLFKTTADEHLKGPIETLRREYEEYQAAKGKGTSKKG